MTKREDVEDAIRSAFRGVTLDGGVSLEQTKHIDDYCANITRIEFRRLPEREVTDDWEAIPASALDQEDFFVGHLDPKGFRYYIPALMLRLFEKYAPDSFILDYLYPRRDKVESMRQFHSVLDRAQRAAIAIFLQALPDLVELSTYDETIVKRAIRNYWHEFLVQ